MSRTSEEAHKINLIIGNEIKKKRLTQGKARNYIAKKINISGQQIAKYEDGSNYISAARLYLLAQHLNVPVQEFFGDGKTLIAITSGHRLAIETASNFMKIKNPRHQNALSFLAKALTDEQETVH